QFYVPHRPHVFQRIALHSDQVGDLSWFQGAKVCVLAERLGNVDRGGLNSLHGCEARLYEHDHFFMDSKSRQAVIRVRSRSDDTAAFCEPDDEIVNLVVALASTLKPIGGKICIAIILSKGCSRITAGKYAALGLFNIDSSVSLKRSALGESGRNHVAMVGLHETFFSTIALMTLSKFSGS